MWRETQSRLHEWRKAVEKERAVRTPTDILCKSVGFRASSLVHQYAVPTATWSGLLEIEEELQSCWLSKRYTMQAGKKKIKKPARYKKIYI